ncbi:poly(R)-hydroxyalkanoic acid synthase subunit PhaE [Mycobacterium sp. 155]|uniref:poly(R)-hydroxyalkanoic acid synthase subunit PhaE n=1 Tax=Mycobacterium sp. 155 TaxID=1157943 RepID=UPI0003715E66|nr:poly(R)-hydroxyalkanoic acid synthase subunit PhaE [Mycobacterium sp. 155]
MTAESWEDQAKRWRQMYVDQAAQAQNWFNQSEGAMPGTPAFTDLWRSWTTLGNSLWGSSTNGVSKGIPGAGVMGGLPDSISLSLAGGGVVSDVLRKVTEGPSFADVGAPERLMARVMEQWLAVQKSTQEYELILAANWAETNTRYAAQMAERHRTGQGELDAKEALKVWLDISNQVLLETQRSEKFLAAQRQLLRDGLDFILVEREFIENLVKPIGLPTRSEIDEVHQNVHELKKQVKALQKTLRALTDTESSASGDKGEE